MLGSALLGLAIGAVMGLSGAGGGIFAVPALVLALGMEQRAAGAVALLAVGAAAALGAVQGLRQGIVRYRAALLMAGAGALSAPWGLYLAQRLAPQWLAALFAVVMLAVALRMLLSAQEQQHFTTTAQAAQAKVCQVSQQTGRFAWNPKTFATLALVGAVAGLFSGLLGVGGGFIIVPALAYVSNLRMQSIVATSLLIIALLSSVTVSMALVQGLSVDASGATFTAAAMLGMLGGRKLSQRMSAALLHRLFAMACVLVAALMVQRALGT